MPKDDKTARRILQLCLKKDLEERYLVESEFLRQYVKYCDYMEKELDMPDLDLKRNEKAFWHYHATRDLQYKDVSLSVGSFDLSHDEQSSYQEIVDKIRQDRVVQSLIYMDKYFKNPYQCKRAELIIQAFKLKKENYLIITESSHKLENFQEQTFEEILPQGEKAPHDRYLILKVNDTYEIWHISQSDFFDF